MTVEYRLAMMRVPDYEPELDLIAVAPDGRFAAFCVCHISREENALTGRNEGYTDPVGTHPAFQRQGLARALLLTGLHLLKQRGMDRAILGTWGENIAMQRTAASVGFRVESTTIFFELAQNLVN
jgi:ribosomal protein S18 acetylase RimI-like enzyme